MPILPKVPSPPKSPEPMSTSQWKEHCQFEPGLDPDLKIKMLKNFEEVFKIVEELGTGSYGDVFLVKTLCDIEPCFFALKILKNPDQDDILNRETINIQEISKFPHCHPSFVCFYDAFGFTLNQKTDIRDDYDEYDDEGKDSEDTEDEGALDDAEPIKYVGILTEYIDGSDLTTYCYNLTKEGKKIDYNLVASIGQWLLYSVGILHDKDIVHRDIKPDNIMFTKNNKPKLLDFGLSCHTEPEIDFKVQKIICAGNSGTKGFAAPEIYTGLYKRNPKKYYRTADAFSIGATLYYLLTCKHPYIIKSTEHEDRWIYRPLGPDVPSEITYIIEKLLVMNPDNRMSIMDAYNAFKKYNLRIK